MDQELPVIDLSPRNTFLGLFNPHVGSALSELFLSCGPRAGIVMGDDIMAGVIYNLRSHIDVCEEMKDQNCWREVLCLIAENWDAAAAFAEYCVRYSALPERYRRVLDDLAMADGLTQSENGPIALASLPHLTLVEGREDSEAA